MSGVAGSLARVGSGAQGSLAALGEFSRLAARTFRAAVLHRWPGRALVQQLEAIGAHSLPIVAVTATFTGMVLALQTAFALARFGARPYVGSIVGLAIVRELGPVLAALMLAGRVGAGIASELGSMQVTEQVDAIRAMGADPLRKLVLPRVLACTLALPLLAVFSIVLGILGGMAVANLSYGLTASFFLQTVTNTVTASDFASGIAKTVFFGALISLVGCHVGLGTRGGTAGVGRATTRAVVVASIAVLISDFFLTKLLLALPTEWLTGGAPGLAG